MDYEILQNQTLIITEKPSAAKRLAISLDYEGKPKVKTEKGITYYIAKRDKGIIIVPALGHLYTVAKQKKGKYSYPVFNFRWVPRYLVERKSFQIKARIDLISELSKNVEEFVDACDYDIEGSIIGYTVLRYACGNKEKLAHRMRYLTLTREEIIRAYSEMENHLDFPFIEAGLARHEVDWLYGINLSRALTLIVKNYSGNFTKLSTGRVQGPTLNILEKREIQRKSFVPTPFWCIKTKLKIGNTIFEADYEKKIIKKKEYAKTISENCKGINCQVKKIHKKKHNLIPLFPFYLGSLQTEAYKLFKISPGETASITQRLYLDALISYPRTSSQKFPPQLNHISILEKLQNNLKYEKLISLLIKKKFLKPIEGPKYDPAHFAIFPTGKIPERKLNNNEKKILDLIIKRYLATFGDPAIVQKTVVSINIDNNVFLITGNKTLEEGWVRFYQPYYKYKNNILPPITEKTKVKFINKTLEKKFTNPPPSYNPSTLLRKMEKENIGTKSTRSEIIQILEKRKYIHGKKISITELGLEVVEILKEYCPIIISIELTRKLEERMQKIKEGKEKREEIIKDTLELLMKTTETLKTNAKKIGARLNYSIQQARLEERVIGTCPSCKNGKLILIKSKKTSKRFVGCTNYFKGICKRSFPLPQKGQIRSSIKKCKNCNYPQVTITNRGRGHWNLCLNPKCPSKRERKNKLQIM